MSTCDVSIGGYDGDEAQFYEERVVKARKPHQCYECGEEIKKGEIYHYVVGVWNGDFDHHHFCAACWEISGEFTESGGRQFGVMWDDLKTNWEEGVNVQACINRLTSVAAKSLLARRWRKWKGLE